MEKVSGPDTFSIPKSLMEVMGIFFLAKNTLSSYVNEVEKLKFFIWIPHSPEVDVFKVGI